MIPSAAFISDPIVLVTPLVSEALLPSMVNPLMVTPEAATWNISPDPTAFVAGTTMASPTREPEHGSIALFGPRMLTDSSTIMFSAYVPAHTWMTSFGSAALIAAWIVA